MNKLNLKDISFSYSQFEVLKNISIDLQDGWTSIVGPNGAGKSTLLNIMNGFFKPSNGNALIMGKDIVKLSSLEKAKLITTIHQQPTFRFPITCFEMVSNGRYPRRKNMNRLEKEDYEIIYKVMEETKTLEFKDKAITELSGGERQRVILATALAQEPKILLIDEGFSALDIKHKSDMIHCIKDRVKKDGLLVVAIIHDLNVAYQISDHVILLKNGQIIKSGMKTDVMTKELIEEIYETDVLYDEKFGFNLKISV